MPDKRQHWEERYADPDRQIGQPSEFFESVLPDHGEGYALDVACGSGRHSIALARRGYRVEAIDLAYAGLRRLRDVAIAERLGIDTIQADLETYPLPERRYQVAVNAFYLQRDLFPAIKRSLAAGGLAIVETFLVDQREIGHPRNPAFLLERGELRERFSDFEILESREGLFRTGDESAYLARLAARKPLS
jgi:SAM-dependent methyltransferase